MAEFVHWQVTGTIGFVQRVVVQRRLRRFRLGLLLLGVGAGVLSGCGDDDAGGPPIDGSAYVVALGHYLPPPTDIQEDRLVVFVKSLGDEAVSLDDQVTVIDALAETYDIRFVDDAATVIDETQPDAPLREGGLLIGLGQLSPGRPHKVRVEVYISAQQISANLLTLVWRNEAWAVESVETVAPEGLIDGE